MWLSGGGCDYNVLVGGVVRSRVSFRIWAKGGENGNM